VAGLRRWIFTLAALAAGAVPVAARATLVYDKNPIHPSIWVAADDGSGAHRLASGSLPKISPDGHMIAYMVTGSGSSFRPDLMIVPADGSAPPRTLAIGWRDPYSFAWSPDARTIVTVVGPELGRKRLVSIDVASGAQRTIASGFFYGVSFAPAGNMVVYARSAREAFPQRSDIYSVAVAGGTPQPITSDHHSLNPLWGPRNRIVFVKLVDAKHRRYGPKNELYLMRPNGGRVRRLTHTRVDPLLSGLSPTQWSADGSRLLAEFGGQDTSYAVTVNPSTGAQRQVTKAIQRGFVGTALSADGRTVLGATGGFEPGPKHDVVTIPYAGGRMRVLVRNASDPDWNG